MDQFSKIDKYVGIDQCVSIYHFFIDQLGRIGKWVMIDQWIRIDQCVGLDQ
jgi:hypothetical protein